MTLQNASRSPLIRLALGLLLVAFALAFAHSAAPDHESHLAGCAECEWTRTLTIAVSTVLIARVLLSSLRYLLADTILPVPTHLCSPGRSPPIR